MLTVVYLAVAVTAAAQQPRVEPAEHIRQLHQAAIKPASEVVFNVGREAPRTSEDWMAISHASAVLIQSANLLVREAPTKNRIAWITFSRQLAAAGRAARHAAETRDVSALMRTSDRLVTVCESCHAPFRKPAGQR